eukprot:6581027-Pyramimonas_sp.AAC.1
MAGCKKGRAPYVATERVRVTQTGGAPPGGRCHLGLWWSLRGYEEREGCRRMLTRRRCAGA